MILEKDGVRLTFPEGWEAIEGDKDNGFHKKNAAKTRENLRSVDIVAYDSNARTLWLIEIKDHTRHKRVDDRPLHMVLAEKAIDTMGSLHAAAKTTISESTDVLSARKFVSQSEKGHFIYIGMEPAHTSRLWGTGIDKSDLGLALRQRIRCIDAHPRVANTSNWPRELQWNAQKS